MATAVNLARLLRDAVLDIHDAAVASQAAMQSAGFAFPRNRDAEQLRLLLQSRVQIDVTLSMALAHLADEVIDALERTETSL